MSRSIFAALFLTASGVAFSAAAQSWVQVEALPDLRTAEERARAYSSALKDVNGFRLRSGWYALTLGPYSDAEAQSKLRELRGAGIIPRDSYISDNGPYRQRFWPIGAGATNIAPVTPVQPAPDTTAPEATPTPVVPAAPVDLDETPREARASEALLSRDQKKELQVAMQWFGFYNSAIDGSFGRGTRGSMAEWQKNNGYDATGILTTKQRKMLMDNYNGALAALGLGQVKEVKAGIEITMPIGLVEFDKYEYPFVQYREKDSSGIEALLISQPGDENTLFGLYEIMQTLEIVPLEGERSKGRRSFTLTGQGDDIHSYTYARAEGGYVKGFTLVYPPAKAADMARVIEIMQDSMVVTEGTLTPDLSDAAAQGVDLLSGLDVRKPALSRSGFYVDGRGHVLTTAEAVASCGRITLDDTYEATVKATGNGLALLEPSTSLVPLNYARLATSVGRLRAPVAVAGYSYEGALDAPTLTYGTLEDLKGLGGEAELSRLDLDALPGDVGGPVLDMTGAVSGMLVDHDLTGKALPSAVRFSLKASELATFLSENGITAAASEDTAQLDAEDIVVLGTDMTVLVGCWE
ncbi:Putative peptidoglycan binding domain-containing protein [Litoreibacter ascidiaceicola]|uniref:Putative peptidoglycan binding domain-containing protein n=1 Tax=Litoreibacter ascidiaceicola TaxID=1486859 RepID=A0A1M4T743_9RHOB|nr:serine protease [Litoreibacter ascidiaceicola]SHE40306.1 Putative peptidoglycan binding domain-containing protein [Litoreibacter ascidiaceicola]